MILFLFGNTINYKKLIKNLNFFVIFSKYNYFHLFIIKPLCLFFNNLLNFIFFDCRILIYLGKAVIDLFYYKIGSFKGCRTLINEVIGCYFKILS